jgi:hypothetical protein
MFHDESLGKNITYLYDANTFAKMGEQGIISTNETINLLLHNIPNAILYKPTQQIKAKNEAFEIGTRLFVPMDGSPPVIYVGETSNQTDNRALIEQSLGYLTSQGNVQADRVAQGLVESARTIREALSPIEHLETLVRDLGSRSADFDSFVRQYTDALVEANPASLKGLEQAKRDELNSLVKEYFMKMESIGLIDTARKAEMNKITALLPVGGDVSDAIALIAEVWSNPEAKRLLDRVMIGDNVVNTNENLSEQTIAKVVKAVNQMGESNVEDQTIGEHFDAKNSEDRAIDNLDEDSAEDTDTRDTEIWADEVMKAQEQAAEDAGEKAEELPSEEISAEDKEELLALSPSANNLRRFFRSRLFSKDQFGPMDVKLEKILEDYSQQGGLSPADALLFNTLLDVVGVEKTLQSPVFLDDNNSLTSGREILGELGGFGSTPVVGNNEGSAWKGRRGEQAPFVGAWHTLMTGRQNGRTGPTLAFEKTRYQKFAGGFLDRVPAINDIMLTQVDKSINEAVDKYNDDKHKNKPTFIPYPRAYVDIPLTKAVYDQIGSYLPTGKLAEAEATVRENLEKMLKLRENTEKQRDMAKAEIEAFTDRALADPLAERIKQFEFNGTVRSMIEAQILDEAYNLSSEITGSGDTRLERLLSTYATKSRFKSARYQEVFNDIQKDAVRLRNLIANADTLIESEQEATGQLVKDRGIVYFADPQITLQQSLLNSNIQKLNQIVNKDMESVWRTVVEDDSNPKSVFSERSKKFIKINEVSDLGKFRAGYLEQDLMNMFSRDGLRGVFLRPLVESKMGSFGRDTVSLASREMEMPTKTTSKKKSANISEARKAAKKQRKEMVSRLVSMIQNGATRNEIQVYLAGKLEGRFDALENNPDSPFNESFKAMLDEVAMPSDALIEILRYDEGIKNTEEAARLNKAEHVLVRAERLLAQLNDPKTGYFSRLARNTTTDALAGIHTFIANDSDLNPLGSRHKVPVTMTFVPEGALSPVVTEMTRKDELAAYRSKWNQKLKNEANPYEFYIRQQAVARALTDYAEKADVLHKAIKKHETYYNNYNPAAMIQQVTDTISIQGMLAQDRINRIKANAEGVRHVISPDAMALLSIPSEQSLYSVSSVRELNELADKVKMKRLEFSKASAEVKSYERQAAQAKAKGEAHKDKGQFQKADEQFKQEENFNKLLAEAKVKEGQIAREIKLIGQRQVELRKLRRVSRHTLPENFTERKELIAHLVNDGEWLLLGSITAEQDLKNRFVSQGKRDTRPQPRMRDIVLSSVPEEGGTGAGNIHLQNRMGFTSEYRNKAWGHTDFKSDDWTLDPSSTRESAAKQFATRYSNSIVNRANWRLVERRNSPHPREGDEQRKVDTSNNFVQKTLANFSFYVESIALAYDRNTLTGDTRKRVFDFLKTVADGTIDTSNAVAESVDLIDLYASVVTEIEGIETMNLLTAGIVPLEGIDQTAMKFVHTHPSKIRMLYAKDHFAQMEARRLFGYLDHGFDMKAGRNGHKNQFEEEKKKLEESAKLLGLDSMQQSIPYVIASLRGLTKTRNSSVYHNLKMWSSDFQTGARDLKQLHDAQNDIANNQKLGKVRKWFTAEHVDIIRDYAMVKEIYETIRPILRDVGTEPFGVNKEEYANNLIAKAIEALQAKVPAELRIPSNNYSDQLGSTFKGLSDASELTLIMMSHPDVTPDEGQAYQKWLHGGLKGDAMFVSTVPLRYGHAANPKFSGKSYEPREYNADPLEEVRMTDLSLLGGVGKQARYRQDSEDATVYRPINLNGLSGTISLLDDTIYRLNVTPVYSILRKMIGKEEVNQRNQGEMVGSKIFKRMEEDPNSEIARKWRVVLGSVSEEMDIKIATDMQFGVSTTGFSETLDYLSTMFTVRALLSLLQLWQQSAPSFVGYWMKKALTGNYKDGNRMTAILAKVIASKVGGKFGGDTTFNDDAKKFVAEVATWVNFRGADGIDKLDQLRRKQVRHGAGFAKKWSGYVLNQIANLGEKGLDFTIAKSERALARSIFITELMTELRFMEKNGQIEKAPESENDLISGNWPLNSIPMEAIQYAETKVSDHMGIADKANKSLLFRSVSKSPIFNHLMRTGTRFSTHTATTSSGMAAALPTLWRAGKSNGKLTVGGHRAKMEAIENILGTVIQNSMFHAMKIKVMVPIVLSLAYMFGGDDEEEAQRKAQEMTDKLLAPDEDDNAVIAAAKGFVFGKESQFFRDDKSPEAASASAYAGLTSSMLTEMFPMVHPTAAILGFLPASDFFKKAVTNDLVQTATAKLTGLESAENRWDDDAVYIYEREAGWYETIMGWTAPTAVAYDLTSGAALAGEAMFADEASAFDIAAYLASEVIPTTRESRGYLQRKLEEPVWEQRSEDNR